MSMQRIFASFPKPDQRSLVEDITGLRVTYETQSRLTVDVTCDSELVKNEISHLCSSLLERGITKFEICHYAC